MNMENKIQEMVKFGEMTLSEAGIENAKAESEMLLGHVLQKSKLKMYMDFNMIIPSEKKEIYKGLLRERAKRRPLQYILQQTDFHGLEFKVTEAVLVPRPETEELVELALNYIGSRFDKELKILDVGTGCGNIAVSIAKNSNICKVFAMDNSEEAIAVAKENAENNGVAERINFLSRSIFDDYAELKNITGIIDVILSNPPYIPTDEIKNLMPEISQYEPFNALNGGADGLDHIKQILRVGNGLLEYKGTMIIEIGEGQDKMLKDYAAKYFSVDFQNDLAGKTRFLIAEKR